VTLQTFHQYFEIFLTLLGPVVGLTAAIFFQPEVHNILESSLPIIETSAPVVNSFPIISPIADSRTPAINVILNDAIFCANQIETLSNAYFVEGTLERHQSKDFVSFLKSQNDFNLRHLISDLFVTRQRLIADIRIDLESGEVDCQKLKELIAKYLDDFLIR
jgi:hypothetical protein